MQPQRNGRASHPLSVAGAAARRSVWQEISAPFRYPFTSTAHVGTAVSICIPVTTAASHGCVACPQRLVRTVPDGPFSSSPISRIFPATLQVKPSCFPSRVDAAGKYNVDFTWQPMMARARPPRTALVLISLSIARVHIRTQHTWCLGDRRKKKLQVEWHPGRTLVLTLTLQCQMPLRC